MSAACRNHIARKMNPNQRKQIGLQAMNCNITRVANANQVSRNFVYEQKSKAVKGVELAFTPAPTDVLYHLPVTLEWLKSFVLGLVLHCKASIRAAQKMLEDFLDYSMSIGAISNLINDMSSVANVQNQSQDLGQVTLGAHDEMFAYNKPILSGIDIPSLYCYLLSQERHRDADTWGINLLDLQKQRFNPERIIADDAHGLRSAHDLVLHDIPCDYDHFHISRDMMDMRRYFRNQLCSAETEYYEAAVATEDAARHATRSKYKKQLNRLERRFNLLHRISTTINILISWMEHDVFNMPGAPVKQRRELFNFILQEFEKLSDIHPHRIQAICTKLRNQRDGLLAFVDVLDCKFHDVANRFGCSVDTVWDICQLQRCEYYGDTYHQRSLPILDKITEEQFESIEDEVLQALDSTEKTSSMIENLNGRVKSFLRNRKQCNQQWLDLIRFYLNHTPFKRSARPHRVGKTPAEILTGRTHPHWLEMLGFTRFKRKAA